MSILYKLTDRDGYTRRRELNETLWEPGYIYEAVGEGAQLCSSGVIHAYRDLRVGLMLNPIHANLKDPRAFKLKGAVVVEDGTKVGCKQVSCLEEVKVPEVSTTNRVAFAILAAKKVWKRAATKDEGWLIWADKWLSGQDRSAASARAARAAAEASWAASARAAAEASASAWAEASLAARAAWAAAARAAAEASAWAEASWAARAAAEAASWAARAASPRNSPLNLAKIAKEAVKIA